MGVVEEGNVFTLEFGTAVPGRGYIGLEEDVLVDEPTASSGSARLSASSGSFSRRLEAVAYACTGLPPLQ